MKQRAGRNLRRWAKRRSRFERCAGRVADMMLTRAAPSLACAAELPADHRSFVQPALGAQSLVRGQSPQLAQSRSKDDQRLH